jgi:uracil-DNA glycosylase
VGIDSLEQFLRLLKNSPSGAVFNPWWQVDEENDIGPHSPAIRRKHLAVYFRERLGKARLAIVGEALGYRGGHFSGIPMTSERMLLSNQKDAVAALYERRNLEHRAGDGGQPPPQSYGAPGRPPLQILSGIKPRRTSKPSVCPDGFSEPTATIVWGALLKIGVLPDEFVLWNAFPWHSFDPRRGLLSNRMPNKSEQLSGRPVLKAFLELFPCEQIVALGKIAAAQLEELNVNAHCTRHPASGGAKLFRQQIARALKRLTVKDAADAGGMQRSEE